jgi:hypothetical protein
VNVIAVNNLGSEVEILKEQEEVDSMNGER